MYLTLSAPGFGRGGELAHALLAEVLATRLTRLQARCPIPDVTLRKHCDAMALLALSLARSLALALVFEERLPAQALSSPRRSALRLNSVAVSSTQKSVANAEPIPQPTADAQSATAASASDPTFMASRFPRSDGHIPHSAVYRQNRPHAWLGAGNSRTASFTAPSFPLTM
jgi:hypothetical protein